MTALVDDPDEVVAIAAAASASPLVAFDLEFLSQDRLVPTLCLLQVAWLGEDHGALDAAGSAAVSEFSPAWERHVVAEPPRVALVDPLAVDVRPIVEALAAHPWAILHAGRQDLALLAARFDVAMPSIVDTQVMAAFAGIGDQIGFANLANELLGTSLGKEHQWTDWARRPLSEPQLVYADADVRHLPAIFARLATQLGERLAWARAESALVAADALAAARVTPETAWRSVGGVRGLDGAGLAALAALAAWRFRVASEHDRPLGQVLNDKVLVDLARQRPADAGALRAVKGLAPFAKQRADDILAALTDPPALEGPRPARSRPASVRAQRWSEILVAIVQLVAEQSRVAPRLLATRSDAEEFARTVDEHGLDAARSLPALATWRREILGSAWSGWLTGRLALVGDPATPSGMTLRPCYDQPTQ